MEEVTDKHLFKYLRGKNVPYLDLDPGDYLMEYKVVTVTEEDLEKKLNEYGGWELFNVIPTLGFGQLPDKVVYNIILRRIKQ